MAPQGRGLASLRERRHQAHQSLMSLVEHEDGTPRERITAAQERDFDALELELRQLDVDIVARQAGLARLGAEGVDTDAGDPAAEAGLSARASGPAPGAGTGMAMRATGPTFATDRGEMISSARPGESFAATLPRSRPWNSALASGSLGQAIRAMTLGDYSRLEPGFRAALQSSVGPSGGYLVPVELAGAIIDRLRAEASVVRAGAVTLPLMVSGAMNIASIISDPKPSWGGELTPIAESQPTFGMISLSTKRLAVIVPLSLELLQDAQNIDGLIIGLLGKAFALEIDRVALLGTGIGAEPKGIINGADVIPPAGDATDKVTYDQFTDLYYTLRNRNVSAPLSAIYRHDVDQAISKQRSTSGDLLRPPEFWGDLGRFATTQVPQDLAGDGVTKLPSAPIFMGAFSDLLLAFRQELFIDISREASPYFNTGAIAIRAFIRMDVATLHTASFLVRKGASWTPPAGAAAGVEPRPPAPAAAPAPAPAKAEPGSGSGPKR